MYMERSFGSTLSQGEFALGGPEWPKTNRHLDIFEGELFIEGHSFAIHGITHKREYLRDHPVSRWLRDQLSQ